MFSWKAPSVHTPISSTTRAACLAHSKVHVHQLWTERIRKGGYPNRSDVAAWTRRRWARRSASQTIQEQVQDTTSLVSEDTRATQMYEYKYEFDLPEGRVVIQPLTPPLIDPTADLLAASFLASSAHLAPYTRYLRANIRRYLQEHCALPPRALVLVAVLLQPHQLPQGQQQGHLQQGLSQQGQKGQQGQQQGQLEGVLQPGRLGQQQVRPQVQVQQQQPQQPRVASGGPAPTAAAVLAAPWAAAVVTCGAIEGREAEKAAGPEGDGEGGLAGGAGAEVGAGGGVVVGSAEVSFHPGTRSPQPFLNAPEKCSYLCNMAVAPEYRRRGVATRLLRAAEEVAVRVMQESEMYLHLRFVDGEAAALYERTGFRIRGQHWPIVPLVGLQRLKLMHKEIAK